MHYTQNNNYLKYIEHRASGNIDSALESLKRCIEDPAVQSDAIQHADLLQRIGILFFEKGNTEEAIKHFEQSEKTDPTSLLMPYYYAKFLAESVGRFNEAIAKCETIVDRAQSNPFEESEDDFSSEYYIQMANTLKDECMRQRDKNAM